MTISEKTMNRIKELDAIEFFEGHGYTDIKRMQIFQLGDSYVGLRRFMYTCGVCYGLDETGYRGRFCFDSMQNARFFLHEWDGQTLPVVGEDGCTAIK